MKKIIGIILFVISFNYLFSVTVLADAETNSIYLRILQSSNNAQGVVSALPDVEKLWPQEPVTYLKSVNQAAYILGNALNNADVKQAFVNLFANMMQKSCPTNEEQAIYWVELKRDTIKYYFNFDEIKTDKSQWIAMAKFIGEVRSKIIPDYKPRGLSLNGFGFSSQDVQATIIQDRFQPILRNTDQVLISDLLYDCHVLFPSSSPTNTDFIKKVSDTAHLTDEEHKELNSPRQP